MTWSLTSGYYPVESANWPTSLYWITGAATAILLFVLFVTVLLHECGEAGAMWTERRGLHKR